MKRHARNVRPDGPGPELWEPDRSRGEPPPDGDAGMLLLLALGQLDERETRAVRRHLRGCARCAAALHAVALVADVIGSLSPPSPLDITDPGHDPGGAPREFVCQ